jgi:hypothetical protein
MLANKKKNNNPQTSCQLLLGVNDQHAATAMRLDTIQWDNSNRDTENFLVWIKEMIANGFPVIIGVYMNKYLFYGINDSSAGDADYDHIVLVTRVESVHADTSIYCDDDVLYFSDHGLWSPIKTGPQYIFSYKFGDIVGNRKEANSRCGPVYTLPNDPMIGNYGIATIGPIDENNELLPVRVNININYESPEIGRNSNARPLPMTVDVTITISELLPNVPYKLYKYGDQNDIPKSSFNQFKNQAVMIWDIEISDNDDTTVVIYDTILSSDKAIYRAVCADSP